MPRGTSSPRSIWNYDASLSRMYDKETKSMWKTCSRTFLYSTDAMGPLGIMMEGMSIYNKEAKCFFLYPYHWAPLFKGQYKVLTILLITLLLLLIVGFVSSEAASETILDDFEWKVPALIKDTEYDQLPKGIFEDELTGDAYVIFEKMEHQTQDPAPLDPIVVCHFNTSMNTFDSVLFMQYPGPKNDYLIYNRTWYTFFVTSTTFHLRVGNETIDTLRLTLTGLDRGYYDVLGVYKEKIRLLWSYFSGSPQKNEMMSIDIHTFEWTMETIIPTGPNPTEYHFVFKEGILYIGMNKQRGGPNDKELMYYTYDIDSGSLVGPIVLYSSEIEQYGNWDLDIDSEGNIHLLLVRRTWNLIKFTPSGEQITSVDLDTGETRGFLVLMLNESDIVNVIGWLYYNTTSNGFVISFTLPTDYSSIVRKTILEGTYDTSPRQERKMMAISGDQILITLKILVDDVIKAFFNYKIQPAPDLAISPNDFTFKEQVGSAKRAIISVGIRNIGRAKALTYWVSVHTKPLGDKEFSLVDEVLANRSISPGGNYIHIRTMNLPRGSNSLRIIVHDTFPVENYLDNNVFDILVFVSINNPPTLELYGPANGTVVDRTVRFDGLTEDFDGSEGVVTTFDGLPTGRILVLGTGLWNHTIDLHNVTSGDYLLSIRAFDGQHYSPWYLRSIRIDHPEYTFVIDSYYPQGSLSLIVGTSTEFVVNVTDFFSRPITYNWSIGGSNVGSSTPYYMFEATTPSEFIVRVDVTNNNSVVYHEWNVSVREAIDPFISSRTPDSDHLAIGKNQVQIFSITISNPDELEYSVLWKKGGMILPGVGSWDRSFSFNTRGTYSISVFIVTTTEITSVSWNDSDDEPHLTAPQRDEQ